jgi:hypothetical protein
MELLIREARVTGHEVDMEAVADMVEAIAEV